MFNYNRFVLENGLRVIHLEDKTMPMVVVNTLYDVGARDESPNCTGMAHLFEHLMFGGSAQILAAGLGFAAPHLELSFLLGT